MDIRPKVRVHWLCHNRGEQASISEPNPSGQPGVQARNRQRDGMGFFKYSIHWDVVGVVGEAAFEGVGLQLPAAQLLGNVDATSNGRKGVARLDVVAWKAEYSHALHLGIEEPNKRRENILGVLRWESLRGPSQMGGIGQQEEQVGDIDFRPDKYVERWQDGGANLVACPELVATLGGNPDLVVTRPSTKRGLALAAR